MNNINELISDLQEQLNKGNFEYVVNELLFLNEEDFKYIGKVLLFDKVKEKISTL